MMVFESNVVDRAHERKLLLELILCDQRHNLFGGQRPLQLLAIKELRFDIFPWALSAGRAVGREGFGTLPIATGEASRDQVSDSA